MGCLTPLQRLMTGIVRVAKVEGGMVCAVVVGNASHVRHPIGKVIPNPSFPVPMSQTSQFGVWRLGVILKVVFIFP